MQQHYQQQLATLRKKEHPHCVLCNEDTLSGFHLDFETKADGTVEASFPCSEPFQGYSGVLHGGIICSLLDAAMTNCLFAHGIAALTGEMTVRFLGPALVSHAATVVAHLEEMKAPLYVVEARLMQEGVTKATSKGKFVKRTVGRLMNHTPSPDNSQEQAH